jgi:hypothetical protein
MIKMVMNLFEEVGRRGSWEEVGDGPSYLSDYYAIRIEICLFFALTTTFLPGKK